MSDALMSLKKRASISWWGLVDHGFGRCSDRQFLDTAHPAITDSRTCGPNHWAEIQRLLIDDVKLATLTRPDVPFLVVDNC